MMIAMEALPVCTNPPLLPPLPLPLSDVDDESEVDELRVAEVASVEVVSPVAEVASVEVVSPVAVVASVEVVSPVASVVTSSSS